MIVGIRCLKCSIGISANGKRSLREKIAKHLQDKHSEVWDNYRKELLNYNSELIRLRQKIQISLIHTIDQPDIMEPNAHM